MPRRGRCRCGNILVFHRGPQGYKMRCPQCLAVVRLHLNQPAKPPPPKNRPPADPFDFSAYPPTQVLEIDENGAKDRDLR
jgi:hypothetical protein